MAIGKNAKKRAARRAFHDDPNAIGEMPYSFKVVRHIDGKPHVVTFASLSAYKEYRERFFASNPTGTLSLASHEDETVRDTGKAFRSKVINRGGDTSKAKPKALVQFKGNTLVQSAKGKRFRQEGFPVTDQDIWQAENRKADSVRQYDDKALQSIRRKYQSI